jgi:hypothetical protein
MFSSRQAQPALMMGLEEKRSKNNFFGFYPQYSIIPIFPD